jgi:nucleotide-binding universal stress UspA family protein
MDYAHNLKKGDKNMTIVVCYDGTRSSKRALGLIPKYIKDADTKVYIFTSLEGEQSLSIDDETAIIAEEVTKAEARLEYAKEFLKSQKVSAETHLHMQGLDPGEDIVKFADEVKADFIVVGIAKKSRLGKMIFGSTAQYVILKAHCPVISVN